MLRLQVKNLPQIFRPEVVWATAADITEVTNDLENLEYLDDQSRRRGRGQADRDVQIKQAC